MSYPPTFRLARFPDLVLEWNHGGGYAPGLLLWRLGRRLLAVVEAGQA